MRGSAIRGDPMFRKTIIAGLIFLGLVLFTYRLLRSPETGTPPVEGKPRPVAKLHPGDVDTLEIIRDGVTTVIKKQGGQFRIVKPVSLPAQFNGATLAFEAIEQMDFVYIVTENKDRHDEYELGEKSLRMVAKKGDTVLMDLRVGKTIKLKTLVRLEGQDQVWFVANFMKYMVDKDTMGWRDNRMTEFKEGDVNKLTVATKEGAKITVARTGPGGPSADWRVIESSVPIPQLDKTIPNGIVNQMAFWTANGWADHVTPLETGLDHPELTITVDLVGNKQQIALIGKAKNDEEVYARVTHDPQVYLVKNWALEKIDKHPIEFREKTICHLTPEEITEIQVSYGKISYLLEKRGKDFVLVKPAGMHLQPDKITSITQAFTNWKAQSYTKETKNTGLGKPKAMVSVRTDEKNRRCELKVGNEISGKYTQYIEVAGEPAAMVAPKSNLDSFWLKPEDFKKN
jgi:hypothetical protein